MQKFNPKVLTGAKDWFDGLPVDLHRYVPYNGAVSSEQLEWLKLTLARAAAVQRSVLVFTHVPLYEPATHPKTVVWNCEDILALLRAHRNIVAAVLAGHDHSGGYAVDDAGIHHITMNSPLTTTPGTDCCAVLELHADGTAKFVAHGRACVQSGTKGAGKHYPVLDLRKGVENVPSGLAKGE
eukprot:1978320-Amphidinium_carterae.1